MTTERDDSSSSRPAWQRPVLIVVAVVVLAGAAFLGRILAPLVRGGGTAPASTVTATPSTPAATAAAPVTTPETTLPALEASRDAKPRTKKRGEALPPIVAASDAAPTMGELHIDSDMPGAMVFLDRKYLGNAPITAKDVPPGTHQLNLTAEGYDGYSEPIDVAVGPADVMIRFKEVRLKETAEVVHKHAMGSCEGRLFADPQGVRYETTNKSDAFTMRFADIEAFEIDYLQKNLKIKRRGGKSYNFTTKATNADPLFVFHRNVDKVRQQIAGGAPAKK